MEPKKDVFFFVNMFLAINFAKTCEFELPPVRVIELSSKVNKISIELLYNKLRPTVSIDAAMAQSIRLLG